MSTYRTIACAVALIGGVACAQDYPTKPVRLVVGFPPGGSNDIVARHLAPKLGEILGVQTVVENRPGANAIIGTEYVAKSPPDGYTLFLTTNTANSVNPYLFKKLPYDPLKDFTPIGELSSAANLIAINPNVPAKDLKELLTLARTKSGGLTYGSAGNGTVLHLAGVLFTSEAGVDIRHVPYMPR